MSFHVSLWLAFNCVVNKVLQLLFGMGTSSLNLWQTATQSADEPQTCQSSGHNGRLSFWHNDPRKSLSGQFHTEGTLPHHSSTSLPLPFFCFLPPLFFLPPCLLSPLIPPILSFFLSYFFFLTVFLSSLPPFFPLTFFLSFFLHRCCFPLSSLYSILPSVLTKH